MSITATKRAHHQAMQDAVAFRNLFPHTLWDRWEFAGSLRRNRSDVGDVEHVVIPCMAPRGQAGLFSDAAPVNILWDRVEELLQLGSIGKHVYETVKGPQFRWGEKYRGIEFRDFNHEIFIADSRNWGSVFAIRTVPGEYSQRLVMALQRHGRVNRGGYVRNPARWECPRCHLTDEAGGDEIRSYVVGESEGIPCERCGDIMEAEIVPVPEEADFFAQAGITLIPPERRV
jgi:DNA polymerase/3'-5' exonuclease PolX